jgi:hypothetical protein
MNAAPVELPIGKQAATMAASCAFMLQVATPPNALVFATGHVRVVDMVRAELVMNLLSVMLVSLAALTAHAKSADPAATLKETVLYADFDRLQINPRHIAFAPQYPLWSDGATKRRWLSLPPESTIDASEPDAWKFPVPCASSWPMRSRHMVCCRLINRRQRSGVRTRQETFRRVRSEPTSPTVPSATADDEQYDDNYEKRRRVHADLLGSGATREIESLPDPHSIGGMPTLNEP